MNDRIWQRKLTKWYEWVEAIDLKNEYSEATSNLLATARVVPGYIIHIWCTAFCFIKKILDISVITEYVLVLRGGFYLRLSILFIDSCLCCDAATLNSVATELVSWSFWYTASHSIFVRCTLTISGGSVERAWACFDALPLVSRFPELREARLSCVRAAC